MGGGGGEWNEKQGIIIIVSVIIYVSQCIAQFNFMQAATHHLTFSDCNNDDILGVFSESTFTSTACCRFTHVSISENTIQCSAIKQNNTHTTQAKCHQGCDVYTHTHTHTHTLAYTHTRAYIKMPIRYRRSDNTMIHTQRADAHVGYSTD